MTTINVKYIGQKDRKEDNVASSGLVWHGHGDVQQATPGQWAQLSKHPNVWERAEDEIPAPAVKPVGETVLKLTLGGEGGDGAEGSKSGTAAPGGEGSAGEQAKAKVEQTAPARKTAARKTTADKQDAAAPGGEGAKDSGTDADKGQA